MPRKRRHGARARNRARAQTATALPFDLDDAQSIASVIVRRALEWMDGSDDAPREPKLALARYLAEYLGSYDKDVKAVYVTDPLENDRAENDPSPHAHMQLVVLAEPKTAALEGLVRALTRALTVELRERVGWNEADARLQALVVESGDLEYLTRYAALLPSYHRHATPIWERARFAE